MQPIFHWLSLRFCIGGYANFMFCVGGYANFSVFRDQHVGIPNPKLWWGPNANGFALEWNIGLTCLSHLDFVHIF